MTDDQSALLAKARSSTGTAESLARDGYFDFAVSRAYYAMFYAAETLSLTSGLRFSSHAAVISAFGRHFAKPSRVPPQFHHYLIDAQDSRIAGDYDIHSTQTSDDAALAISRACEFIACAEQLLTGQGGQ